MCLLFLKLMEMMVVSVTTSVKMVMDMTVMSVGFDTMVAAT